ncbi:reverse transcriptase domain-containing protein [Aeromonas sp. 600527]|uniref:reverse transcriptase domain-containing protein n=1 Tax=Aeromonas sp. 600527 TaxID=2712029 RepID=UPI003B9FF1F5
MGGKASKRRLHAFLNEAQGDYTFVVRTDIRGYYQHIDKHQVLARVVGPLPSPVWRDLTHQYLYYSVEQGGEFHNPTAGIGRGCALSPLIGASLLYHIDADFAGQPDLYYARYIDDFIILARTRWRLRRAIVSLRGHLAEGRFSLHPDKTRIGKLAKGVDWLGGWFNPQGLVGIAPRSLQQYRTRSLRLYEQALRQGHSEEECQARVRIYRRRWRGCF